MPLRPTYRLKWKQINNQIFEENLRRMFCCTFMNLWNKIKSWFCAKPQDWKFRRIYVQKQEHIHTLYININLKLISRDLCSVSSMFIPTTYSMHTLKNLLISKFWLANKIWMDFFLRLEIKELNLIIAWNVFWILFIDQVYCFEFDILM